MSPEVLQNKYIERQHCQVREEFTEEWKLSDLRSTAEQK